jgi:elongation factor P
VAVKSAAERLRNEAGVDYSTRPIMIAASQLRAGMAIKFEGQDYRVVSADYHPGQGQMGGATSARLQNLTTRTFWEHRFRSELKLEEIPVEKQPLEFLYAAAGQCCFMNPETFEQTEIQTETIGPLAEFMEPGMKLSVEFAEGRPVNVVFPDVLEVRIADTAPPIHQQQDNNLKPAKLDNGVEVMVPQFIKTGDVIRLDPQTIKYVERVKADAKAKHA